MNERIKNWQSNRNLVSLLTYEHDYFHHHANDHSAV